MERTKKQKAIDDKALEHRMKEVLDEAWEKLQTDGSVIIDPFALQIVDVEKKKTK